MFPPMLTETIFTFIKLYYPSVTVGAAAFADSEAEAGVCITLGKKTLKRGVMF